MSNLIILGLGSTLLGFVISYVLWIKVRASLLRAELQMIRAELDATMKSKGANQNIQYFQLREFIHDAIENSEYFSIPILWVFVRLTRLSKRTTSLLDPSSGSTVIVRLADLSRSPQATIEVKEVATRVYLILLVHHLLTPSMILLATLLTISGRTETLAKRISTLRNNPQDIEKIVSYLM